MNMYNYFRMLQLMLKLVRRINNGTNWKCSLPIFEVEHSLDCRSKTSLFLLFKLQGLDRISWGFFLKPGPGEVFVWVEQLKFTFPSGENPFFNSKISWAIAWNHQKDNNIQNLKLIIGWTNGQMLSDISFLKNVILRSQNVIRYQGDYLLSFTELNDLFLFDNFTVRSLVIVNFALFSLLLIDVPIICTKIKCALLPI